MTPDEIKKLREKKGWTQLDLAKKIGVSLKTITNYETGGVIPSSKKEILRQALNSNNTIENEAALINNPNIIMIPLVSQYAYAGYMHGYSDADYIETLPKIPVFVDHELKGEYQAFEVRGDSMDDGTRESICQGDKLICRQIKQCLWQYKLHMKKWNFVIVHKTEGILVKRIIEHKTDTGVIILHSLNPMYENLEINLNDVMQMFNVVEIHINGRL